MTSLAEQFEPLSQRCGEAHDKGATLYQQGDPGTHLYVVLEGRIVLTHTDTNGGSPQIVRIAGAGDVVGEDGVLGATAYRTSARVLEPAKVAALDRETLAAVMRERPEAGMALVEALLTRLREAAVEKAEPQTPETARPAIATKQGALEYDEERFFADGFRCPVCDTTFQTLRVRSRAVNSVKRESDFHYIYRSVNPLHYAVTVCPSCYYAAYQDDFETISRDEAKALLADADARRLEALDADLRGERDYDAAALSLKLALRCYARRKQDQRRYAGVLHRLAWVERERGDTDRERELLAQARDAYCKSFEMDASLSEGAAVTLSYLIGELSLRLGEYEEAVRWFSQVTRMPESKKHPEILRLTRDRWADARELSAQAS